MNGSLQSAFEGYHCRDSCKTWLRVVRNVEPGGKRDRRLAVIESAEKQHDLKQKPAHQQ